MAELTSVLNCCELNFNQCQLFSVSKVTLRCQCSFSSSLNVLLFTCLGHCDDKGPAGADGSNGKRFQPRYPSHHLFSSARLCPGHAQRTAASGYQEKEECRPEVQQGTKPNDLSVSLL